MTSFIHREDKQADADAQRVDPSGFYSIEIMLSSGLRKSQGLYDHPAYRELGEDAAGVLALPRQSIFWLADGTGGEPSFPQFSPRILAQDAGTCLTTSAHEISSSTGNIELLTLIKQMLESLQSMWKDRITTLWTSWQAEGDLESYLRMFSPTVGGSRQLSLSSTFCMGLVDYENARLDCLNWGDSGCIVQCAGSAISTVAFTGTRLWIKLQSDTAGKEPPDVIVRPNDGPDMVVNTFDNVEQFLCLSDGNSRLPLEKLFSLPQATDVAGLARFVKALRQETGDDRALILGTRWGVAM